MPERGVVDLGLHDRQMPHEGGFVVRREEVLRPPPGPFALDHRVDRDVADLICRMAVPPDDLDETTRRPATGTGLGRHGGRACTMIAGYCQMHLGVFVLGTGNHSAGWRYDGAAISNNQLSVIQEIARIAERGRFDLVFVSDGLVMNPGDHPSFLCRFEPTTLISALSAVTTHVGLGATVSTSYSEPYNVARIFASIDHISNGRAAWNMVTSTQPCGAQFQPRTTSGARAPLRSRQRICRCRQGIVGLLGGWRDRRRQNQRPVHRRCEGAAAAITRAGFSRSRARSTWRARRKGIR